MTRAPRSARINPANGAATLWPSSITVTPFRGLPISILATTAGATLARAQSVVNITFHDQRDLAPPCRLQKIRWGLPLLIMSPSGAVARPMRYKRHRFWLLDYCLRGRLYFHLPLSQPRRGDTSGGRFIVLMELS